MISDHGIAQVEEHRRIGRPEGVVFLYVIGWRPRGWGGFFFSVQCKSVIGCWRKVMFLMRYLMYRLGGGGGGILLTAWVLFSIPAPTVDVHFVHRWR